MARRNMLEQIREAFEETAPEGRSLRRLARMEARMGLIAISDRGVIAEIDYETAVKQAMKGSRNHEAERFWHMEKHAFDDWERANTEYAQVCEALDDRGGGLWNKVHDQLRVVYPNEDWRAAVTLTEEMQGVVVKIGRELLGADAPEFRSSMTPTFQEVYDATKNLEVESVELGPPRAVEATEHKGYKFYTDGQAEQIGLDAMHGPEPACSCPGVEFGMGHEAGCPWKAWKEGQP